MAKGCRSNPPRLPPAIIAGDAAEIAAAAAPGLPVTILSPPGFACYGGALLWQTLLAGAGWTGAALLDCADAPGRAADALRVAWPCAPFGIVLRTEPEIAARIAAMARETDVLFLEAAPPALDLSQRGARRRLAAWLAGTGAARDAGRDLR